MVINSTLCYLIRDDAYLMLHRTKKEGDYNKDKWIGVGGKFEEKESPEDCVKREVLEETGYCLKSMRYRGIVTFLYQDITEYMHLFTSDSFEGEEIVCDEGDLEWVPISEACNLPIWEGDKLFFRLLEENAPFFSLKLEYDDKGNLLKHTLHSYPDNTK
ncbi:MAG: 8-oxo-dGTP diphosphatase [Lachnospiraceae bacterium]|jgi:8-oxo-dGTP diphosphatase|nr:8-oxo-dGTP diphosphatase [Lachnospiraceae bacterium]